MNPQSFLLTKPQAASNSRTQKRSLPANMTENDSHVATHKGMVILKMKRTPCVNSNVLFKTSLATQTSSTLIALPSKTIHNYINNFIITSIIIIAINIIISLNNILFFILIDLLPPQVLCLLCSVRSEAKPNLVNSQAIKSNTLTMTSHVI